MKSDKATTIGLGLVMAMSSAAHADTLQNIIDKGEVAIGVKADFAPWGMRDTNGNVVGLEIDLGHVDKWRSQRRIDVMSMKPRKLSAVLS